MPTQNIGCNIRHAGNQAVGDEQRDQSFFLGRFLDKAGMGKQIFLCRPVIPDGLLKIRKLTIFRRPRKKAAGKARIPRNEANFCGTLQ